MSTRSGKSSNGSSKSNTNKKAGGGKRGGGSGGGGAIGGYRDAIAYLTEHIDVERMRASRVQPGTFTLERITALMEKLGNPQHDLRCVHIAGTNGKGSTVGMIDHALRACGLTVGTYTSPHVVNVRERIRINGANITQPAFTNAARRVAEAEAKLPKKLGSPTYFELMTAMGFVHLAEQAVDVALIEVGLGGRLDATNVVQPLVAAVTAIGLDHQQFLGETVVDIAREKAGIFKPGAAALTIKQDKQVIAALREEAEQRGAELEVVGQDIDFSHRFEAGELMGPHVRIGLSTPRATFEHVPVPVPGEHQAFNCGLALAVLDKLAERGFELGEAPIVEGLSQTRLDGRMELIPGDPRILLDGAHNPAALAALVRSVGSHIPYDSMITIFGCASDKDIDAMLSQVAVGGDKIVFTRARGNSRAMDPHELGRLFEDKSPKMYQVAEDLDEAISIASRAARRDDLVCVTGSFYLVGEAKKLLATRASPVGV